MVQQAFSCPSLETMYFCNIVGQDTLDYNIVLKKRVFISSMCVIARQEIEFISEMAVIYVFALGPEISLASKLRILF